MCPCMCSMQGAQVSMGALVCFSSVPCPRGITLFSSLGTFQQKKKQTNSDLTDASV